MKKLLLFIAAAVFAASAAFAQYPVPDIEPVPDGITIAVHIPDGTDCYGAPLWGGDTNPSPWSGEEMVAVEVKSLQTLKIGSLVWATGILNGECFKYWKEQLLHTYNLTT